MCCPYSLFSCIEKMTAVATIICHSFIPYELLIVLGYSIIMTMETARNKQRPSRHQRYDHLLRGMAGNTSHYPSNLWPAMNKEGFSTERQKPTMALVRPLPPPIASHAYPLLRIARHRNTHLLLPIGILFSSLSMLMPKHQNGIYEPYGEGSQLDRLGTVKWHKILHDSSASRVASTYNAIYFGFVTQRTLCRRYRGSQNVHFQRNTEHIFSYI